MQSNVNDNFEQTANLPKISINNTYAKTKENGFSLAIFIYPTLLVN